MIQPPIRILVVDDEPAIRRALRPPLMELGFHVAEASRGEEALQALRAAPYDAVLLDINMPGIGGIETLKRIRAFAPRLPVLMLTVRDEEEDKVEALDLGADDYVTKPFSPRELAARVTAVLRRYAEGPRAVTKLMVGDLQVDFDRHEVKYRNEPVVLTAAEFKLLTVMARNPGRVFTRLQLMDSAFGETYEGYDRTIDAHIKNMRQKFSKITGEPDIPVITVRGVGYKLE